MLLYALSACLWLLASGEDPILEDARVRFHKSSTPLPRNYLIAPEILEGRRTFFVLDYDKIPSRYTQSPPRLRINVRKYDDHPDVQPKRCVINRTAREFTKEFGVDEFHRLGDEEFLFTWYDETRRGDRLTYLVYANIEACRPLDFSPNVLRGRTFLVPTVYEMFNVLVDDPVRCKEVGKRCRVSYDPDENNKGTVLPFNVSLDWDTLYVEYLPSGAFIVRGYEGDNYKVMHMDKPTGEVNLLSEIPDKDRRMEFVSSGMAFCSIDDPGDDRRTVSCKMLDESRQEVLTARVKYDEPVGLVDVHPVKKEGELFVVTLKRDCYNGAECWELYGTRVDIEKYVHVPLKFVCTEEKRKLMFFDAVPDDEHGRMELHYACRNGNSYTFSTFFVY